MKFLRKKKIKKTIIVISDIHLGAGEYYNNKRNYLEDFHFDEEFIDFLDYFSSKKYEGREVELIINGDFFDLLAVPYVEYFDDEYWSEDAAKAKLEIILDAHPEVIEALGHFLDKKNKTITFIIGNHDAELVFDSLQEMLLERIPEKVRSKFTILLNQNADYRPHSRLCIKHGHEYELAHIFDPDNCVLEREDGKKFFNAPWGSYYVIRVINKFKEERDHVNAVRPINKFLINGLIYDTVFTFRFMLANLFYFLMVRTILLYKTSLSLKEWISHIFREIELFQDYESLTYDYLKDNDDTDILIVGHTHEPTFRTYANGKTFINTGTWTRMYHLDFGKGSSNEQLSFAKIDVCENQSSKEDLLISSLNNWRGSNKLPYSEIS